MSQQAMLDSLDKELKESEFNSKWKIIIFDFFILYSNDGRHQILS